MKWMSWLACVFLVLLSETGCVAADEVPPLKIEGVKAKYLPGDPITIKVTNVSSQPVSYGLGVLSSQSGDKWYEFLTNIEDHEICRKAFMVRKLLGNESKVFTWNPKDVDKPSSIVKSPIKTGVYRFYISYKDKNGKSGGGSGNIGAMVDKHYPGLIFSDIFELQP